MTTEEIIKLTERKPHLFILGAGATKACIPNGDKNNKHSPVMEGFLLSIGKENILNDIHLETKSNNIEAIYSELYEKPEYSIKIKEIESVIIEHCSKMQIPDEPILYDYLIVSLRSKDCIATFNWDPLLVQAYKRARSITKDLPRIVFLHGNVAIGLCKNCNTYSPSSFSFCPKCDLPLEQMPLLYPVKKKDYNKHWGIEESWKTFNYYLEIAAIVTIWGYSAPDSDITAKDMMLKVFSGSFRKIDQIEIVDIADLNEIIDRWAKFSQETNYHLKIVRSLKNTILWEFPRRSVEGYAKRFIGGWWGSSNLVLQENLSWPGVKDLLQPLIEQEKNNQISIF